MAGTKGVVMAISAFSSLSTYLGNPGSNASTFRMGKDGTSSSPGQNSTGDISSLTDRATSLIDSITKAADSASQSAKANLTASFASLNSVMAQLAALAPEAGATVSTQAAENIASLNSKAASLAKSLGISWTPITTKIETPSVTSFAANSTGRLLDISA